DHRRCAPGQSTAGPSRNVTSGRGLRRPLPSGAQFGLVSPWSRPRRSARTRLPAQGAVPAGDRRHTGQSTLARLRRAPARQRQATQGGHHRGHAQAPAPGLDAPAHRSTLLTDSRPAVRWSLTGKTVSPQGRVLGLSAWQMLVHLVNHGTHHRSEVAELLTRLNSPPPGLDPLIYFGETS